MVESIIIDKTSYGKGLFIIFCLFTGTNVSSCFIMQSIFPISVLVREKSLLMFHVVFKYIKPQWDEKQILTFACITGSLKCILIK